MDKFNNEVAPWLRLLTPLLMVLAMFILNNISSNISGMTLKINEIGIEQARRTILVSESYDHLKDRSLHK